MKFLALPALAVVSSLLTATAAPVPVGSISENHPYAELTGGSLTDRQFSAHDGKILWVQYYTPW